MAEVPDAADPGTQLNRALIDRWRPRHRLLVAGEASSHCVRATTEHLVEHLGGDLSARGAADRLHEPGGRLRGQQAGFLAGMQARGVRTCSCAEAVGRRCVDPRPGCPCPPHGDPVISLLETDLYKFTMWQAMLHRFPQTQAEYTFICRNAARLPAGRADRRGQRAAGPPVRLSFQPDELAYLRGLRFIKTDFVDFLRIFRFQRDFIRCAPSATRWRSWPAARRCT
jgi:hypothetical protein